MPLLTFLIAIAFIPGIPSSATVPRWALAALGLAWLWRTHPHPVTVGHCLGALFLAWCALTVSWSPEPLESIYFLGKFGVLGLAFCVGAGLKSMRGVYIAAALGATVNSGVVIAQVHGWDIVSQMAAPAGLFFNKNFAAEYAVMAAVGVLTVPRYRWLAIGCAPAIVLCHARGAYFALAAAGILLIYQLNRVIALGAAAVGLGAGVYLGLTNYTFIQRVQLWQDTAAGLTWFGRGIGSYFAVFPQHATRIDVLALRPTAAHNDLLQLWFEVGVGALVAVALLGFAYRGERRAEHYVLMAFIVAGLVSFPLSLPATAVFAAVALGHLYGAWPDVRSSLAWRRVRVLFGAQRCADDGSSVVASGAGANALALRPQHQKLNSLFLYGFSIRGSQQGCDRGDRG